MNLQYLAAIHLTVFLPIVAGTRCVDEPGFVVDNVYTCDWFASNKDSCRMMGDNSDGVSPTVACCACGGGTAVTKNPTPAPTPLRVCQSEPGWNNGIGDGRFDCEWYAQDRERCTAFDIEGEFGMFPGEACCACGGGVRPTRVPSPTPAPTPTVKVCVDEPDFVVDSVYTCEWFESNKDWCGNFDEGSNGMTAEEACCACGGGEQPCEDVNSNCDMFSKEDWPCTSWGEQNCCSCGGGIPAN